MSSIVVRWFKDEALAISPRDFKKRWVDLAIRGVESRPGNAMVYGFALYRA